MPIWYSNDIGYRYSFSWTVQFFILDLISLLHFGRLQNEETKLIKDFFVSKSVSLHKSAKDSATHLFEHPQSQPTTTVATEPYASALDPTNVTSTTPSDATDIGHVANSRVSLALLSQHDKLTLLKNHWKPNVTGASTTSWPYSERKMVIKYEKDISGRSTCLKSTCAFHTPQVKKVCFVPGVFYLELHLQNEFL